MDKIASISSTLEMAEVTKSREILHRYFGYKTFRTGQEEIIEHLLQGNDALVIMPTGGGKSICFQIPALVMEGLTIVVSPLIALMKDQVMSLRQNGISARAIHSHLSEEENREITAEVQDGSLKLLYVSPEKLLSGGMMQWLESKKITLIAIDEAHCVSVWGNDFRPNYVKLKILKQKFPKVPVVALTATADTATQEDIIQQLSLESPKRFISSFERENITTTARGGTGRVEQIISFLDARKDQCGIIYCLSRKGTEGLASKLQASGFKAQAYHAGLTPKKRHETQIDFQRDEVKIVCATIAFGMGIDKSNVRFVIHYNLPKNIEGYYQEIGRAGRDGLDATALLFYSWGDIMKLRNFVESSEANETFKKVQRAKLDRMWEYANATSCRTNLVLNYFGEYRAKACGHCDNCLTPPSTFEGTVVAQKALSAVLRCKESTGLTILIDILRGSGRREIIDAGYQNIKTYGAGRDISFVDWREYITQMLNQGLLMIDYTDQARLKTTPLSSDILKGKRAVMLTRRVITPTSAPVKKKTKTVLLQEDLFQKLREWRRIMSNALGIPAFTIFHDSTLVEIANSQPKTMAELHQVEGIGKTKLDKYGRELLDMVRDYYVSQNFKQVKGSTFLVTLKMLEEGMTPQEIASQRGVKLDTVFGHLIHLKKQGESIQLDSFINAEELSDIQANYIKHGRPASLKDLNSKMETKYAYYKLNLAIFALEESES